METEIGLALKLDHWLDKNKLTKHDLSCIAFVPNSTFKRIVRQVEKGGRSLPALYRLYLVTEIEDFKLTEKEMVEYHSAKMADSKIIIDEMIALYFLKRWKAKGEIPQGEDRLNETSERYQDKKVLTNRLYKKYIMHAKIQNSKISNSGIVSSCLNELKTALKSDIGDFISYVEDNKKELKALTSILNFLLSEGPEKCFQNRSLFI